MTEWTSREERQAAALAEYEHIMTTPGPDPSGAYIESGVIGFVFGEMWRRGVLTARDRRLITLSCVGAAGAATPIETHVWAALNSGDLSCEEYDEFVLHFATQVGWPKGSVMNMYGMMSMTRLAEQQGRKQSPLDFEPWAGPTGDDQRRSRGQAAYRAVHGADPEPPATAFRGRAYLDYLYGEIWTRQRHLTRRDRRIVSICGSAALGVDEETREHLRASLAIGDLGYEELQELVFHYSVYVGWPLGRHLDDLLIEAAHEADLSGGKTAHGWPAVYDKFEFASPGWVDMLRGVIVEGLAGRDLSEADFVLCEEYTNPPEHLRRPGSESIGLHIRVANGTIEVNDQVIDGSETTKKLICDYEWAKRYAMRYPDPQLRDQLIAEGLMRVEGEGDMSQLPQFWLDLDTTSLIRPRTAW